MVRHRHPHVYGASKFFSSWLCIARLARKKPRRKPIAEINDLAIGNAEINDSGMENAEIIDSNMGNVEINDSGMENVETIDSNTGNVEINDSEIEDISKLDLAWDDEFTTQGHHVFRRGTFEGMPIVAKKLNDGEDIPVESLDTNRNAVSFVKAVKDGAGVYVLYRPFEETLENFLETDENLFETYGGQWCYFTEKSRSILLSLVRTLYFAHKSNRVHNKLSGSIFVMKKVRYLGNGNSNVKYYVVITNDFTTYGEADKKSKDEVEMGKLGVLWKEKSKNWNEIGGILELINTHVPELYKLDKEIENLMRILNWSSDKSYKGRDDEKLMEYEKLMYDAKFREKATLHSPALWSNSYRREFDKWVLGALKGAPKGEKELDIKENNLFHVVEWRDVVGREITDIRRVGKPYEGGRDELIRFVRHLSEHPEGFSPLEPSTQDYPDIFAYVRWKFPHFHLVLVAKCIERKIEEWKRGLKHVPAKVTGEHSVYSQGEKLKRRR